jgi:hypothetical protein
MTPDELQGDLPPVYVGESRLLHYWPPSMAALGLFPLALGNLGGALLFFLPALVMSTALPWRFAVFGRGIVLWFGFGKCRYMAKENVTVRAGLGSTVLLPRGAQRIGYPLTDGFVERRRAMLRRVLTEQGFNVAAA